MPVGVVITKDPVDSYVPLYVRDGQNATQFVMTTLEELGLLKMDFLGLRTLTVIKDTKEMVKKDWGIDVELDKEMNDPKVYKLWQEGKTCRSISVRKSRYEELYARTKTRLFRRFNSRSIFI